jgi:hypothetical protein
VDTTQADANDTLTPITDLKTHLENALNGVQAIERLLFAAPPGTPLTISAGGEITPAQLVHTVAANTGTSDDLDIITAQNNRLLILKAHTGHTITIRHAVSNITVLSGQNRTLSGNQIVILYCLGSQWCVLGDGGGAASGLTLSDILTVQVFS